MIRRAEAFHWLPKRVDSQPAVCSYKKPSKVIRECTHVHHQMPIQFQFVFTSSMVSVFHFKCISYQFYLIRKIMLYYCCGWVKLINSSNLIIKIKCNLHRKWHFSKVVVCLGTFLSSISTKINSIWQLFLRR